MIIDVWVRVMVFVCSNVGASLCLVPCSFSALCVPSPFPHPPPLCEVLGDRMPMVWNSACAFAALQSAGFLWVGVSLSPSLPAPPPPSSSLSSFLLPLPFYDFLVYLSFCFPPLDLSEADDFMNLHIPNEFFNSF